MFPRRKKRAPQRRPSSYDKAPFTPTELRILRVLSDGTKHTKAELVACLWDEQSNPDSLLIRLFELRKKLKPIGQDIACEKAGYRQFTYRHVILLPQPGQD